MEMWSFWPPLHPSICDRLVVEPRLPRRGFASRTSHFSLGTAAQSASRVVVMSSAGFPRAWPGGSGKQVMGGRVVELPAWVRTAAWCLLRAPPAAGG